MSLTNLQKKNNNEWFDSVLAGYNKPVALPIHGSAVLNKSYLKVFGYIYAHLRIPEHI